MLLAYPLRDLTVNLSLRRFLLLGLLTLDQRCTSQMTSQKNMAFEADPAGFASSDRTTNKQKSHNYYREYICRILYRFISMYNKSNRIGLR